MLKKVWREATDPHLGGLNKTTREEAEKLLDPDFGDLVVKGMQEAVAHANGQAVTALSEQVDFLTRDRDHWKRQAEQAVSNANARLEDLRTFKQHASTLLASRFLEERAPSKAKNWLIQGMCFSAGALVMTAIQIVTELTR